MLHRTKTTSVLYFLVGLSTSSEAQCHKRVSLQRLKVMLHETIRKDVGISKNLELEF